MSGSVRERVGELSGPPVLIGPEDSLRSVAQKLWEEDVGAAVVTYARRVLGIISERDVVAMLARGANPEVVEAREAMTRPVISAHVDDPMLDVAFLMVDEFIRHVPVLDGEGEVTGMVSMRDVVRPLLLDVLGG